MTDHTRTASEEPPIDITIRRECVYQQFKGEPGPCPRCGGPLQQSRQSYLVATRRGEKITDSFMTGGDMGWFCTRCPTVVMNMEKLSEVLQYMASELRQQSNPRHRATERGHQ